MLVVSRSIAKIDIHSISNLINGFLVGSFEQIGYIQSLKESVLAINFHIVIFMSNPAYT